MIKELLYKWFGLEDSPCRMCELLQMQLEQSNAERKELLAKLLEKDKEVVPDLKKEDFQPIVPKFVPWHVRRQMLEAEDRAAAETNRKKQQELNELKVDESIQQLEKELGVEEKNG